VTPLLAVAVALGAAAGSPLRFLVEQRLKGRWPWGTLTVNVVGSAVLGAVAGASAGMADSGHSPLNATLLALIGTGFCGGLTTFGGFAAQVLDLGNAPLTGATWKALGYAATSLVSGVAAAAVLYALLHALLT
jgi:CrcB protein